MPNRFIKESICTSETIDQLTAEEERLFYRLIVNCDDYGRMDARPEIVRSKCFPWKVDKIKTKDIESWIHKLAEVNLIILYENSGKRYLQFVTWTDHQQVRAVKSKFPAPDDEGSNLISIDINCNQLKPVPANSDRTRISNTNTNSNNKDKGGMGGKEKYAEFVSMTPEEYQKLIIQFGEEGTKDRIERLNLYKGSTGKKYASDYLTILSWERRNRGDKSGTDTDNHTKAPKYDTSKIFYHGGTGPGPDEELDF